MSGYVPAELWPDPNLMGYEPFWQGTLQRRIMMPQCVPCGVFRWPPQLICRACYSEQLTWQELAGTGAIHSFTVTHRPYNAAFTDWVPYTTAVITVAGKVRMLGRLMGRDATLDEIGASVRPNFQEVTDEIVLVNWERTE
jgi:uncharacterized OB-fold protein